jgi:6-phosphogluconolactonase
VLSDADAVGAEVWKRIDEAGKRAVEERGTFTLAIPGGSVLKMLAGSSPSWAEDCLLAYVNHKAVNDDDAALSTHAKARAGFLDAGWDGVDVLNLGGSSDAVAEACRYAELLELATQQNLLPVAATATGETIPVFDMMVIGVGDDGHVGSLYPNRDECTDDYSWCLPVEMKDPGSISLSLPVMRAAREVLVAACGVSEKYPQGKSDAMRRAIETEESIRDFPAAGLRDVAQYVFDEAAASKLTL